MQIKLNSKVIYGCTVAGAGARAENMDKGGAGAENYFGSAHCFKVLKNNCFQ